MSVDVLYHDDVIKWKHFPRYWPLERGFHRSSLNSPNKGQWRGALMFSLICTWINGLVNNREAGDLRRKRAHHDVTVIRTLASHINHSTVCANSVLKNDRKWNIFLCFVTYIHHVKVYTMVQCFYTVLNSIYIVGCGGAARNFKSTLTHWPLWNLNETDFSDWWLKHLLWNWPNMYVTGLHWWSVNFDSGNGLVPSGIKPLP